jgi:hypothetical protein
MEKILVIADPIGGNQEVIARAIGVAQKTRAELLIVGFVYEHIANLPDAQDEDVEAKIREKLVAEHRKDILKKFREASAGRRRIRSKCTGKSVSRSGSSIEPRRTMSTWS